MQQEANKLLKWLYCLALISVIFPVAHIAAAYSANTNQLIEKRK